MRTVTEVINQAIQENRWPEYLLYAFACIFVLTGEALIGWSLYSRLPLMSFAGAALNGLAWPAYNGIKRLRAENLMLRMLEIPLSKAKTADEAAKMLTERFTHYFKADGAERGAVERGFENDGATHLRICRDRTDLRPPFRRDYPRYPPEQNGPVCLRTAE